MGPLLFFLLQALLLELVLCHSDNVRARLACVRVGLS